MKASSALWRVAVYIASGKAWGGFYELIARRRLLLPHTVLINKYSYIILAQCKAKHVFTVHSENKLSPQFVVWFSGDGFYERWQLLLVAPAVASHHCVHLARLWKHAVNHSIKHYTNLICVPWWEIAEMACRRCRLQETGRTGANLIPRIWLKSHPTHVMESLRFASDPMASVIVTIAGFRNSSTTSCSIANSVVLPISLKQKEIRPKLLLTTNKKLHVSF